MSQIKTLKIDDVEYVRLDSIPTAAPKGDEVIIRTFSAGVHIGTIKGRTGKEVTLTNARRLWSWSAAFTLNAVATKGVDRKNSRISKAVPEITLLEAIEIIPVLKGVDLSSTES